MKIAVTGASGRIGSATVALLRQRGHEVLGIDRRPPGDGNLPHRVVDLQDRDAVRAAFDGCDGVCHLGELPGIVRNGPAYTYAHNTAVGSLVMEAAVEVGVKRIIYTSSCQTYGCWGSELGPLVAPVYLPMDEAHPLNPRNAYSLSKVANENYARLLSGRSGVPVAAFRFPAVLTDAAIHDASGWVMRRRSKKVMHDGIGTYLYVGDAALAYALAIENGWAGFEPYHFVADDIINDEPVPQALAELFPQLSLPLGWPDEASPVVTTKARDHFGWRPAVSLRRMYRETLANLPKAV